MNSGKKTQFPSLQKLDKIETFQPQTFQEAGLGLFPSLSLSEFLSDIWFRSIIFIFMLLTFSEHYHPPPVVHTKLGKIKRSDVADVS